MRHFDEYGRMMGSILVVTAYFVILHVSQGYGVIINLVADSISIPYFIRTRTWDVVVLLAFMITISTSSLMLGEGKIYIRNEENYQADPSTAWVLITDLDPEFIV